MARIASYRRAVAVGGRLESSQAVLGEAEAVIGVGVAGLHGQRLLIGGDRLRVGASSQMPDRLPKELLRRRRRRVDADLLRAPSHAAVHGTPPTPSVQR